MIPSITKQRIQSAAYEKLLDALAWGINPTSIIEETRRQLEAQSFDVAGALYELDRTRLARLQRTQFVYWAKRQGHPRILQSTGQYTYLQEHTASFRLPLTNELIDLLKEHEQKLFDTEDESVVYWRGWHVAEDSEDNLVHCNTEYCTAHIWDDQVHTEARGTYIMTPAIKRILA